MCIVVLFKAMFTIEIEWDTRKSMLEWYSSPPFETSTCGSSTQWSLKRGGLSSGGVCIENNQSGLTEFDL